MKQKRRVGGGVPVRVMVRRAMVIMGLKSPGRKLVAGSSARTKKGQNVQPIRRVEKEKPTSALFQLKLYCNGTRGTTGVEPRLTKRQIFFFAEE